MIIASTIVALSLGTAFCATLISADTSGSVNRAWNPLKGSDWNSLRAGLGL